jgi:hypothetical protein
MEVLPISNSNDSGSAISTSDAISNSNDSASAHSSSAKELILVKSPQQKALLNAASDNPQLKVETV